MRLVTDKPNVWGTMFGIFRVPDGTGRIRVWLNQALRNGVPHDGSAALFDDVGDLFETEAQAVGFVTAYR